MLREIRDLGFEYAELSHGIRVSLVPGIIDAVEAGVIKISTLHNFCPLPMGVNHAAPNLFKFSASEKRERDLAWKHSIKTIETAELWEPSSSCCTPVLSISLASSEIPIIRTSSRPSPRPENRIHPSTPKCSPSWSSVAEPARRSPWSWPST